MKLFIMLLLFIFIYWFITFWTPNNISFTISFMQIKFAFVYHFATNSFLENKQKENQFPHSIYFSDSSI